MSIKAKTDSRLRAQLALAITLALLGMVLLAASFMVPPKGVIHSSVLVALGEVFTFSASLIGVDYHYALKEKTRTRK